MCSSVVAALKVTAGFVPAIVRVYVCRCVFLLYSFYSPVCA